MEEIPPEFQQFQPYLFVAKQFQSRYPDVADVMNLSFSRYCQDYSENNPVSPEAQQFLKDFNVNHDAPSENAPQITRQVAHTYFNTLLKLYNSKKFSAAMSKQLTMIGFLFDALEGEGAYDAFQKCVEMKNNCQAVLTGKIQAADVPIMDPPIPDPEPQPQPDPLSTVTQQPDGPPTFTPPGANPSFQPPAFTPPSSNPAFTPPAFTPPGANPSFQPPTFTPPGSTTNDYPAIPNFNDSVTHTMPTIPDQPPTFTPGQAQQTPDNYVPPNFDMNDSDEDNSLDIPSHEPATTFDPNQARSLLTTLGYPLADTSTFPPLNSTTISAINYYLTSAIECLKNNDNAQSLLLLQNAYKIWATGVPQ